MPMARFDSPFEHPDWIFEPKLDGFRAVAYVEGGTGRLVSRNRNAFKTFEPLAQAIGQELSGRSAILDRRDRVSRAGRPSDVLRIDVASWTVLLLCVRSRLAGRQGPAGLAAN
jgi:hypothetical protein